MESVGTTEKAVRFSGQSEATETGVTVRSKDERLEEVLICELRRAARRHRAPSPRRLFLFIAIEKGVERYSMSSSPINNMIHV